MTQREERGQVHLSGGLACRGRWAGRVPAKRLVLASTIALKASRPNARCCWRRKWCQGQFRISPDPRFPFLRRYRQLIPSFRHDAMANRKTVVLGKEVSVRV